MCLLGSVKVNCYNSLFLILKKRLHFVYLCQYVVPTSKYGIFVLGVVVWMNNISKCECQKVRSLLLPSYQVVIMAPCCFHVAIVIHLFEFLRLLSYGSFMHSYFLIWSSSLCNASWHVFAELGVWFCCIMAGLIYRYYVFDNLSLSALCLALLVSPSLPAL